MQRRVLALFPKYNRIARCVYRKLKHGRSWCGRLVPDAHGAQSAHDDAAIDSVAIADEVVRSLIPGKGLRYLTCNPFGRGIFRSMAAMSGAWLRQKVRHPWLGGPRRLTMYLATLDCATSNPSLSSSP
jgi:hypothetical protein